MRRKLLPIMLTLLLVLSGCWNRRELETLGIILAAGYDWDPEREEYLVTAQMAKPQAIHGEQGGKGPTSHVFAARGRTVFEASRNLSLIATRKAWWGHVQVLVIGEEAARRGLAGLLDFIERDGETRPLYYVLVTHGRAADILHLRASPESVPALGLTSLVRAAGATSTAPSVRLLDISRAMEAPSAALIAVVQTSEGAASEMGGPTKEFELNGAAVSVRGNLKGFLDRKETRGALWVRNRVKSGIIAVPCPGVPGRHIGVEVIHAYSTVVPELGQGGRGRIRAKVRMEGNVGDQDCRFEYSQLEKNEQLERAVGDAIRAEIMAADAACRNMRADCLGVTDQIMRNFPAYWARKEKELNGAPIDWPVLPEIEVRVRATGAQLKPPKPK
ncbi:MAG TPA: Ger(x)C family spore germination protein [Symbiobacteriaceae bacterium]|nr:Ger(x)C family spore germination protein [Symbiobacteriaceae bacterium]